MASILETLRKPIFGAVSGPAPSGELPKMGRVRSKSLDIADRVASLYPQISRNSDRASKSVLDIDTDEERTPVFDDLVFGGDPLDAPITEPLDPDITLHRSADTDDSAADFENQSAEITARDQRTSPDLAVIDDFDASRDAVVIFCDERDLEDAEVSVRREANDAIVLLRQCAVLRVVGGARSVTPEVVRLVGN